LVELARDDDRRAHLRDRALEHAARQSNHRETASPLVEWCDSPTRAADCGEPSIRIALASEPRALATLLEDYVLTLGPLELGYRAARWLWRRAIRRMGGGR
jgi:hypothetical protein